MIEQTEELRDERPSAPRDDDERVDDGAGDGSRVESGMALALSGGGYRAMLFHVGCLWRLNELGILPHLKRISSVSGGSITAALLGINWSRLGFNNQGVAIHFDQAVVQPIRSLADRTIDIPAILTGILLPCVTISDRIAAAYDKYLYHGATLQNLPHCSPRFVINATSLQTGTLWRFSQPYMADYRVAQYGTPNLPIALAVAASSAFPPVLSPVRIDIHKLQPLPNSRGPFFLPPYNRTVLAADGGVYDNLGIETIWKRYRTLLVSDGGGRMQCQPRPPIFWPCQTVRVLDVIDNQVRSLRKRQLMDAFKLRTIHDGAYWSIRTPITDYQTSEALSCPSARTQQLAAVKTRLAALDSQLQERLINWGYAVCDAAVRSTTRGLGWTIVTRAPSFPYPASTV